MEHDGHNDCSDDEQGYPEPSDELCDAALVGAGLAVRVTGEKQEAFVEFAAEVEGK